MDSENNNVRQEGAHRQGMVILKLGTVQLPEVLGEVRDVWIREMEQGAKENKSMHKHT